MIRSRWYPRKGFGPETPNRKHGPRWLTASLIIPRASYLLFLWIHKMTFIFPIHLRSIIQYLMFMFLCINYVYNISKCKNKCTSKLMLWEILLLKLKRTQIQVYFLYLKIKANNYWDAGVTIPSNCCRHFTDTNNYTI